MQILLSETPSRKEVDRRVRKIDAFIQDKEMAFAVIIKQMDTNCALLETGSSSVCRSDSSAGLMQSSWDELFDVVAYVSSCRIIADEES